MDWFELIHVAIGRDTGVITFGQMMMRAVIVFLIGLFLVRLSSPRIFSQATPIDIIMAVVIGSNLSRTLTGGAPFWPVISATILLVILHALIRWASSHWRPLANVVKGQPCVLARDGEVDWNTMHSAGIGRRDLMGAIRSSGGERIENVRIATLERGGEIKVVLET